MMLLLCYAFPIITERCVASMYKQYTLTRKRNMLSLYRCSGCGRDVLQMITLQVASSYNDKGTFTRQGVAARQAMPTK